MTDSPKRRLLRLLPLQLAYLQHDAAKQLRVTTFARKQGRTFAETETRPEPAATCQNAHKQA